MPPEPELPQSSGAGAAFAARTSDATSRCGLLPGTTRHIGPPPSSARWVKSATAS